MHRCVCVNRENDYKRTFAGILIVIHHLDGSLNTLDLCFSFVVTLLEYSSVRRVHNQRCVFNETCGYEKDASVPSSTIAVLWRNHWNSNGELSTIVAKLSNLFKPT